MNKAMFKKLHEALLGHMLSFDPSNRSIVDVYKNIVRTYEPEAIDTQNDAVVNFLNALHQALDYYLGGSTSADLSESIAPCRIFLSNVSHNEEDWDLILQLPRQNSEQSSACYVLISLLFDAFGQHEQKLGFRTLFDCYRAASFKPRCLTYDFGHIPSMISKFNEEHAIRYLESFKANVDDTYRAQALFLVFYYLTQYTDMSPAFQDDLNTYFASLKVEYKTPSLEEINVFLAELGNVLVHMSSAASQLPRDDAGHPSNVNKGQSFDSSDSSDSSAQDPRSERSSLDNADQQIGCQIGVQDKHLNAGLLPRAEELPSSRGIFPCLRSLCGFFSRRRSRAHSEGALLERSSFGEYGTMPQPRAQSHAHAASERVNSGSLSHEIFTVADRNMTPNEALLLSYLHNRSVMPVVLDFAMLMHWRLQGPEAGLSLGYRGGVSMPTLNNQQY